MSKKSEKISTPRVYPFTKGEKCLINGIEKTVDIDTVSMDNFLSKFEPLPSRKPENCAGYLRTGFKDRDEKDLVEYIESFKIKKYDIVDFCYGYPPASMHDDQYANKALNTLYKEGFISDSKEDDTVSY